MTPSQVHAVLAAGIENPELIERWQKDPQCLLDYGIEPDSIDLVSLWKFAGLTAKVRHNGLREELPMTFRLMNVAGLEIEVFASYAAFCASKGRRYATAPEARTRDLIAFLEHWLDLGKTGHSLLWDLIRHEWALARLNQAITAPLPLVTVNGPSVSHDALSGGSVPRVCGAIILYEMRSDPVAVQRKLRQSTPQLNQVLLGDRYFCYWGTGKAPEIQILELDEFGYYVLSFVDGVHSIGDISHRLGGSRKPTWGFLRSLSELASGGILEFGRAPKASET